MNMSTTSAETWVDGMPMLKQSLAQYFRTNKGSIPLNPQLGFGVQKYVDRNPSTIMKMIREISLGIALWDSRITIVTVTPVFGPGTLSVSLTWYPANQASNIITQTIPIYSFGASQAA